MVTVVEFNAALELVLKYMHERHIEAPASTPNQAGAIVKLSAWGKEMQSPHNKIGVVLNYLEWHGPRDGLVTVKWEGIKVPQEMHLSHIEIFKQP